VKDGGGEVKKKWSSRGSVHRGCDYATPLNIEVDPQRRRFGRRESDFTLQTLTEGRAAKTELRPVRNPVLEHRVHLFSLVPLVWESNPKLQGDWCKSTSPLGIWSPPRAGWDP